ncbi:transcriptional repressor [Apibacter sp.]|uniref:Fur family transcriptional regulator n=1 Tax=Apibacter sp. TaxID=2023709 RepID=UPI0025FC839A|nr:transcriptional repressor [Apibacter sp.]MCT6869266.1 transcriptional repressor [Apibacter sp.]
MNQELENILRNKDINPTAMRLLVLEYFLKQNTAISLSDLESDFDYSDRTTLFRTLKTFEKKGLLHSINEGNITVYALCTDDCSEEHHADSHIHFCCKNCKKIFCMHSVKTPYVNIPSGFIAEKLDIIVHGLCVECSKIT